MDQKTRDLRRRNKALRAKPGAEGLSEFEARGLGRKNKPAATFPIQRCEYAEGAYKITFTRKRKDGTRYLLSILKGGERCPKTAVVGKFCCGDHKRKNEEQLQGVA